jgi:hypothetical protein
VRVAVAHPLLLRGGVLADRQPPARPERLVIVIDEHGLAVLVSGQAVEVQIADFLRPAAGVDGQLHGGTLFRRRQLVEVRA